MCAGETVQAGPALQPGTVRCFLRFIGPFTIVLKLQPWFPPAARYSPSAPFCPPLSLDPGTDRLSSAASTSLVEVFTLRGQPLPLRDAGLVSGQTPQPDLNPSSCELQPWPRGQRASPRSSSSGSGCKRL